MLQALLVGGLQLQRLQLQMGNLPGLQHLFMHCCCTKGFIIEKRDLVESVRNGRRLNEGDCGTCFFPGRAAVTGRVPNSFKDEHSVLRIAGHAKGWCILSSLGLVSGQRYLFPLTGWVHICIRLRCEAAGTGSLRRGSLPLSVGILGPVVMLSWARGTAQGCDLVRIGVIQA